MTPQELAPIVFLLGFFIIGVGMLFFVAAYKKFYDRMKTNHHEKWLRLMNEDPFVESMGEWIRYPFGSIYLMRESLRRGDLENDEVLAELKSKIRSRLILTPIGLGICIIALILK